jgi:hypothetical protein
MTRCRCVDVMGVLNDGEHFGNCPLYVADPAEYDGRLSGPMHEWFELSYAKYLTIPRSIIQSMPVGWQAEFAQCLRELDDTLEWRPNYGRYWVQLRDERGRYVDDPFDDYRHTPVYTPDTVRQMRGKP